MKLNAKARWCYTLTTRQHLAEFKKKRHDSQSSSRNYFLYVCLKSYLKEPCDMFTAAANRRQIKATIAITCSVNDLETFGQGHKAHHACLTNPCWWQNRYVGTTYEKYHGLAKQVKSEKTTLTLWFYHRPQTRWISRLQQSPHLQLGLRSPWERKVIEKLKKPTGLLQPNYQWDDVGIRHTASWRGWRETSWIEGSSLEKLRDEGATSFTTTPQSAR